LNSEGVDVRQVMEEVNRAVAAPETLLADLWSEVKPNAPNLSFLYPPHSRSLEVNLDLVSRNWEVEGEFEISSSRRLVGGVVVALKRGIRGLLGWYINPILHQVRKFNMLVTRTLFDLGNNVKELQDRVSRIEKSRADELHPAPGQRRDNREDEG
jgi:hypothetical protein